MNPEEKATIDWLTHLPDNYTNSGRMLGGLFTVDNFKEIGIVLAIGYMLTYMFLEPVTSPSVVLGIRAAGVFLVLGLNLLIRIAFNSSIWEFARSVYSYVKLTKKFRYKRRDKAYARKEKE